MIGQANHVQEILYVLIVFSDGRGRGQQPTHDALNDARNLKGLCTAAANNLGFQSYVNYLNQHQNEIFQ